MVKKEKDITLFDINFSRLTCKPDEDLDAGIWCYPKCKNGYSPASFYCWSTCNRVQQRDSLGNGVLDGNGNPILLSSGDDWHDDGALCRKRLYDRGIGTIPDSCTDPGKQLFVGLCYNVCSESFSATTWSPSTCSQTCPRNTVEGGFANCTKVNSYGRGAGNWGNGCPSGYDNWGLWCFKFWGFKFSGYNCPQNCKYSPIDSSIYGINPVCLGKSIRLGETNAVDGTPNLNYPFGNPRLVDPRGNVYSGIGCYPDETNFGNWIQQQTNSEGFNASAPQYYYDGYLPKWADSNCTYQPTTGGYTGALCLSLADKPEGDPTACANGNTVNCVPGGLYTQTKLLMFDVNGQPITDQYANTVRGPQQSSDCEENWGSLCYPQCDIGYYGFGCCVCSPSCGGLRDDGATCHREWRDRGVGSIPDSCSDNNKVIDAGLCYTACKENYASFVTTCTRSGCPYDGIGETALVCSKQSYYRGFGHPAVPGVSDKINSKINLGTLSDGLKRIILNAIVIVLCLLAAFFIFTTNIYLRTKPVKVKV